MKVVLYGGPQDGLVAETPKTDESEILCHVDIIHMEVNLKDTVKFGPAFTIARYVRTDNTNDRGYTIFQWTGVCP